MHSLGIEVEGLRDAAQRSDRIRGVWQLGAAGLKLGEVVDDRQDEDLLLGVEGTVDQRILAARAISSTAASRRPRLSISAPGGDDRLLAGAQRTPRRASPISRRRRHMPSVSAETLLV